jgi:hypothetical protein
MDIIFISYLHLLVGFKAEALVLLQPEDGDERDEDGDENENDGCYGTAAHTLGLHIMKMRISK